jgi:tetratricopeptide (TPR) repeat protein
MAANAPFEGQEPIVQYVRGYGSAPTRQAVDAAVFDTQIKTLAPLISHLISGYPRGTVMDIGCGEGILLKKLDQLPAFREKREWTYFATDVDEQIDQVLQLAANLRLHRRVEAWKLEDFYSKWPTVQEAAKPYVCIIRNVLHELDIEESAKLIFRLVQKLEPGDHIIVQDLVVLQTAERGNACWAPGRFIEVLETCGFSTSLTEEPTRSGNRWFTCTAQKSKERITQKTQREVLDTVFHLRKQQYDDWMRSGVQYVADRDLGLAQLDFDLQCAALHQQLILADHAAIIEPLNADAQRKILRDTFRKVLVTIQTSPTNATVLEEPKHFRDRAHDQDWLEEFLLGPQAVAILRGGPFIGKTYLVTKVLANRAHHKNAVFIDIPLNPTVWNFVEQYVFALGGRLDPDLLTSLREIRFRDVKDEIKGIVETSSNRTIVVLDHFERALDPLGRLPDSEIGEFLEELSGASEAKVVISSRMTPTIDFAPAGNVAEIRQIGRFPAGEHVENLLDDFIDRPLLRLDEYPKELLDAIDRHPYLTFLAALIVQREGKATLWDAQFLDLVKRQLRDELLKRLVDSSSKDAIEVLSMLRIPVPLGMLEALAGNESVRAAEQAGLLYQVREQHRTDLVSCIGAIRKSNVDPEGFAQVLEFEAHNELELALHRRIAESYGRLYRLTEDPRWLRELHYHTLAGGDASAVKRFGSIYKSEIFWAGDYWFRALKRYKEALWAFETVEGLGLKTPFTEMRRAACLMRVGRAKEGESIYSKLISSFPQSPNFKTSLIDSLLYCNEHAAALAKLLEFKLSMAEDPWVAHEFGRAFIGLHRYREAVHAFEVELSSHQDVLVYESLARAYHRLGESENVERVLGAGLRRHPSSKRLQLRNAGHLMRRGTLASYFEAEQILEGLAELFPTEGRVLQQYCKLLCLTDRVMDAETIWKKRSQSIYPEEYGVAIQVDILIAKQRWPEALKLLGNVSEVDEHQIGMKKKVYLWWARADTEERKEIAKRGLDVLMDRALLANMPLMVTHARLASLAQDQETFERTVARIDAVNPGIAGMLRGEDASLSYWEDDPFS